MPILDLRLRKAARRGGVRLAVATERPTALDGGTEEAVRYAPGEAAAFLGALTSELGPSSSDKSEAGASKSASDGYRESAERVGSSLRPGKTVVIYGERIGQGPNGDEALAALLACAQALRLDEEGAGLIEVPDAANGRGLREVGCSPGCGPGLAEADPGMDAGAIRTAGAADELSALLLFEADPVRELPNGPQWKEALGRTGFIVAFSMFENASTAQADVVFPAESHAEKEGTVTHPDGRLQRLRPNVPRPAGARPGWQVLAALSSRLGDETGIDSAEGALLTLAEEIPFYAGLTPEEIGGGGVRWQEREAASAYPSAQPAPPALSSQPPADANGGLRLGTYRDLWSGDVPERNPSLRFLSPKQTLELAPSDAERLAVNQGEDVDVRSNGTSLRARVAIRERMRPGAAFLIEGTAEQNATALAGAETVEVTRAGLKDGE